MYVYVFLFLLQANLVGGCNVPRGPRSIDTQHDCDSAPVTDADGVAAGGVKTFPLIGMMGVQGGWCPIPEVESHTT
jgi:hypothetical protein